MTDNAEKRSKIKKQLCSYNWVFSSSDIEAVNRQFLLLHVSGYSLPYFAVFINIYTFRFLFLSDPATLT